MMRLALALLVASCAEAITTPTAAPTADTNLVQTVRCLARCGELDHDVDPILVRACIAVCAKACR